MNTLEVLIYKLGQLSVTVEELVTPKKNWIIPFILGVIACYLS